MVGIPGRVVRRNGCRVLEERSDARERHEHMPDPVREAYALSREKIRENACRIGQLEAQVAELTALLEARGVVLKTASAREEDLPPHGGEHS